MRTNKTREVILKIEQRLVVLSFNQEERELRVRNSLSSYVLDCIFTFEIF